MPSILESLEVLRADYKAASNRMESLHGRARAILNRANNAGRDPTADEQRQLDSLHASFEEVDADLKRLKNEIEAVEATPQPRVAAPNPMGASAPIQDTRQSRLSGFAPQDRTYRGMFARVADPYGGRFETFGEFAKAVAAGNDQRLIRNSALAGSTIGEGASAGYMVPSAFVQKLLDDALMMETVRPLCNVVPITSGDAIIAGFSSVDRTGGKRAGLVLDWQANEAEDLLTQKPIAVQVAARANKASVFCVISTELAEDAPNFDRELSRAMVAAVAGGLDLAFLNGTGAGQPMGVINAPALVTVSKESGQAANTLLLQNLAKMVGRLLPSSFVRAVWFVHPTVVPLLYQLSYTVKNIAGTENVGGSFVPAVTHDADGNLRIFGRPALVTDACSVLSSKGDILLADMTRYLVAMRSDVRLVRDTSRYFDSDQIAFRLTMRLDGMPEDSAATKLRDGTNTCSPFVVLEAR